MKINLQQLIKTSVWGSVKSAGAGGFIVEDTGAVHNVPSVGGINYNVKLGDSAFNLAGDHIEPGVTIFNKNEKENAALNILSCVGNEAIVMSGEAKGRKGFVIGKHGGCEHVLIAFDDETLDLLCIDDKILIRAHGQGVKLLDYPEIFVYSVDPNLLLNLPIKEENGKLICDAVVKVPAYLMGSGTGSVPFRGDYDIMTSDDEEIKRLGIDKLRFGDLVFLEDCDNTYGRTYRKNATTLGIVIHSDCIKPGHGPGVLTILSAQEKQLIYNQNSQANIQNYL